MDGKNTLEAYNELCPEDQALLNATKLDDIRKNMLASYVLLDMHKNSPEMSHYKDLHLKALHQFIVIMNNQIDQNFKIELSGLEGTWFRLKYYRRWLKDTGVNKGNFALNERANVIYQQELSEARTLLKKISKNNSSENA